MELKILPKEENSREIQSAHWNQAQITLYASVSWFREHVVVSDHMQHNKTSVVIFTTEVLAKLPHGVKEVKIWTDGPASQFKNKYVFLPRKSSPKTVVM